MGFVEWMQSLHPHKIFFLAAKFKNWKAAYILEHGQTPRSEFDPEHQIEWWEWCWSVAYRQVCKRKGWDYGEYEEPPVRDIEGLKDFDFPVR